MAKRPKNRVSFKDNKETGEIEEFIIDDDAETASEAYHDKVANLVARNLGAEPEIQDAGLIRNVPGRQETIQAKGKEKEKKKKKDTESEGEATQE